MKLKEMVKKMQLKLMRWKNRLKILHLNNHHNGVCVGSLKTNCNYQTVRAGST